MKKTFLVLLFLLGAIPAFGQYRQPVATHTNADGKVDYIDFRAADLLNPEAAPDPQHVQIQKAGIFDFQCTATPTNPPTGNARFYCDSGTGQMACLTSTGASCLSGGGGGGGGNVNSVGLAAPSGMVVSGSPVTTSGTLTWAMPTGWVLGDLLVGNGSNSVARLAAPTTPDGVPETLISTPSGGAVAPAYALAGLPGRVVSITSDTIVAADRSPKTIEYTNNAAVAVVVPDPGSSGFGANPAFITVVEGAGAVTFTPQTTAVITYCNGLTCFLGQPSVTLITGQIGNWSSPDGGNWLVRITSNGPPANPTLANQLNSGGGVTWTGLLNFTVSSAIYSIAGTLYNSPQTNLTLSAADPTNPRIDVIAVNTSGAAVAITGTPAANPAAPSVDPTSQLSLTFVTIPANSTTPTVSSILVYDENLTPPTEYTCTPTANFNCNSTNNPYHSSKDIEVTTAVAGNNVALVNSGTVNFSGYSILSFNIRNKASWPAAKSLSICFMNGATVVGTCLGFKNGVFGFNQANLTTYQQIVVPMSQFGLGTTVADRIRFQVVGSGASIGFYLDYIQIQTNLGASAGAPTGPPNTNVLGTDSTGTLIQANRTAIDAISYVAGGGTANAQTATLVPAVTALTNGLTVCWKPSNANASTTPTLAVNGLTAKTIIKVGGAALAASDLTTTAIACAIYDGTNFELQNPQTTTAGGITSINTSATGPAVTITATGGASVTTSGNTVTINGSLGPPASSWQNISGNPTVSGSDNGWRDRFTGNNAAITLPQPNTIATNPIVGRKYASGTITTSPLTTSTWSQSAANQLLIAITNVNTGPTQTVSTVTDSAGDSCSRMVTDVTGGTGNTAISLWYCTAIAASGSNAATITWAGNPGSAQVQIWEFTGTSLDTVSSALNATLTNQVHFANALALGIEANYAGAPASWVTVNTNGNQGMAERLLQNQAQVTYTSPNSPTAYAQGLAVFNISAAPTFTAGWYFVAENASSTGVQTITPTSATINGQSTLVMPPGEQCSIMSNGTNYDAVCGFAPNIQTNGVMGGPIEVAGVNTSAAGADHGTSTLYTTAATDAFFEVKGSIACHGVTATGTSTLTITYTDTSNTVQTLASAAAACTTLGAASVSQVNPIFRAKASTNIQYGFAHGGTQPTVDVSVGVYQLSTQ